MDRYELAWAAGFFDGEGWANAVGQAGRRTRQPHARVNQADSSGVPAVLVRFRSALGGLGRIRGPIVTEHRRDLYCWEISSRCDVMDLQEKLQPWLGPVKLAALGRALGLELTMPSHQDLGHDAWRAWSAGLFDGEGWASMYSHRSHVGYLSPEIGVGQSDASDIPVVLHRFETIVGCGKVYGPYEQSGATLPVYRWKATAQRDVEKALSTIWPWLGPVKREQCGLVLEILGGQPTLPRGNPAWGNNKTHCVNGHEYATARMRPFRPRKGGDEPRASSQCLACLREYARRKREEKRSAADDGRRPDFR